VFGHELELVSVLYVQTIDAFFLKRAQCILSEYCVRVGVGEFRLLLIVILKNIPIKSLLPLLPAAHIIALMLTQNNAPLFLLPTPTPTYVVGVLDHRFPGTHRIWLGVGTKTDGSGTVLVFRQDFTLEDAIGSQACSLEANTRVIQLHASRVSTLLPVLP
jgi:hypothetical protein